MLLTALVLHVAIPTAGAESTLFDLFNESRRQVGATPLQRVRLLNEAAEWFARDLAASNLGLDHVDSKGRRVQHRIYEFGYRSIQRSAENLALGFYSPADTHRVWMSSSGHRRNILDPNFEHVGIARVQTQEGRTYWVAEFAQRFKGAPELKP